MPIRRRQRDAGRIGHRGREYVRYKTGDHTCTQLKAKLGVRTLPKLMRIAIQHLPSASAKTPREWS